jgi:hypothetical protein
MTKLQEDKATAKEGKAQRPDYLLQHRPGYQEDLTICLERLSPRSWTKVMGGSSTKLKLLQRENHQSYTKLLD